jgi:hypothetical protein
VSCWIVTRRELKDTPRVRALIDFLVPYIQQDLKTRLEEGRLIRGQSAANDGDPSAVEAISPPA